MVSTIVICTNLSTPNSTKMQDPKCDIADAEVTSRFPKTICHDYGHCVAGDLQSRK
jgi:hypothetical protein